jgi:ribonucleotide reductase alpha subunit
MLKVFNDSACYVNQGGKRKGSTAVYLEPWHLDINEFLDLKKPIGDEMLRARDLFLALWIPDIFMERLVQSTQSKEIIMWSLFCPNECPLLIKSYGEDFTKNYIEYENQKKYRKQISFIHSR